MKKGTHYTKKGKEKQSERLKGYFQEHPEAREEMSKLKKEYYKNHPEEREKQSKRIKEYYQNPEAIEKFIKRIKRYWKNPKAKKKQSKRAIEYFKNNPKAKEKNNKRMKEYWKNLENRKKQSKRTTKYFKNPRTREKQSKKRKEYFKNHPKAKERIKERRAKQILPIKDTKIEIKIQDLLKQLCYDFFTHQHMKEIEHSYQCDILIPALNLVIECDGDYWHKYPVGREIDHIRTKELIEKGFKVLRLWEREIKVMDIDKFKERIEKLEINMEE